MINSDLLNEALNNLANKLYSGKAKNYIWTLEIKKLFAGLFEQAPNTFIYADGLEESCNIENLEFLYDLVVLEETKTLKESKMLVTKCVLALKTQWGSQEHVISDFHKLLLSNAEYKVLVFSDENIYNIQSVLNYMERNILKYININGTFLLIYFTCFAKQFEVKNLGKLQHLQLTIQQ